MRLRGNTFHVLLEHVLLWIETVRCSDRLRTLELLPCLLKLSVFKGFNWPFLARFTCLRRVLWKSWPLGWHRTRWMCFNIWKWSVLLLRFTDLLREHFFRIGHAVITLFWYFSWLSAASSAVGLWTSNLAVLPIFHWCRGDTSLFRDTFLLHWFPALRHIVSLWVFSNSNNSNL